MQAAIRWNLCRSFTAWIFALLWKNFWTEREEPGLGRKETKENEKNVRQTEKAVVQENQERITCPSEKSEFILPEKRQQYETIVCLSFTDKISLQRCGEKFCGTENTLPRKEHGNVVFVGTRKRRSTKVSLQKSTAEQTKSFRMTVAGSDCRYGFCWRGKQQALCVWSCHWFNVVYYIEELWLEDGQLSGIGWVVSKASSTIFGRTKKYPWDFSVWITMRQA